MDSCENNVSILYSWSLMKNIQIKVGALEGEKKSLSYGQLLHEPRLRFSGLYSEAFPLLLIHLQVYNNGYPCSLPVSTFKSNTRWNKWITLPLEFSDLPKTAILIITVQDCSGTDCSSVIGKAAIQLFGKHNLFRQGLYDLRVLVAIDNSAPFVFGEASSLCKNGMQRLETLTKKYRNGQIKKIDWLDRLTFREIEMIYQKERRLSEYCYLMIEFPSIHTDEAVNSVVYYEKDGHRTYTFFSKPKLVIVPDSEISQENLVERKHHRLARSARSGLSDRDAKPTARIRDMLYTVVYRNPSTCPLTSEEQDLLWKYRIYLSSNKKALTKFLKCINWETSSEVIEALKQLEKWAPMDVEDALELLTPAFAHPTVRRYAVMRLKQAPDEDLLLYLLQLVQALKYENFDDILEVYRHLIPDRELKSLDDTNSGHNRTSITKFDKITEAHNRIDSLKSKCCVQASYDLTTFLILRSCRNPTLANYFYWYLLIETEQELIRKQDERVKDMYGMVLKIFLRKLENGSSELKIIRQNLDKQQRLIDELVKLVKIVAKEPGNRNKKTEKFKQLLEDDIYFKINFVNFDPRPFPLDPDIYIKGILPHKTSLFKSALMPSKLAFSTTKGNQEYVAIFKYGDDLRQDQLILQMITLMDKLLRRENLDLKLTPYKVLATSSKHGFLQYIESSTVADVLAKEGSIHNFFRKHNPCESAPYGIAPDVMDTYIKSCAGYCVITYLLGVGDRHLDNLLLTTSGKLFHIDFGYILGRDPKPMPPPMKLSKEMVEAMGGVSSEHHHEFRKQCYTAFLHLRRHANVMLNLFSLMVDASVPDIALEPDKSVKKVEENLRLELSDEEAVQYIQGLLDLSITAVMPALVEQIHKLAQYWRK